MLERDKPQKQNVNVKKETLMKAPIAEEFPIRIEPGEYKMYCHKTETGFWKGKRKIYIRYVFVRGEHEGVELFMPCTYPEVITYRYKYHQQWAIANGGVMPKGKTELKPDIFVGSVYLVRVVDSSRKDDKGKLLPVSQQYSVVSTIIKPLALGDV